MTTGKKPQVMVFENPTFHSGRNVTCRRGVKNYSIGDEIPITTVKENRWEKIGTGTVLWTWVGIFAEIDDSWLKFEHDKSCRDYYGLLKQMETIYSNFLLTEVVTLICFMFEEKKKSDEATIIRRTEFGMEVKEDNENWIFKVPKKEYSMMKIHIMNMGYEHTKSEEMILVNRQEEKQ